MALKRLKARPRSRWLGELVTNAGWGAAVGAAIAGFAFLIGAGRFVLASFAGWTPDAPSWSDARLLLVYVGSFVVAGVLVGIVRTVVPTTAGIVSALALGGVVVMCSIAVADQGLAAMTRGDWIAATLLGVLFGCAMAYGALRRG